MQYVYPAILYRDKKSKDTWTVIFPDVEGAATCGYSLYEALYMAEDALAGMLVDWEDFKAGKESFMTNKITEPTPADKIDATPDKYSDKTLVTLIKVDTDEYRKILANAPEKAQYTDDERELPGTFVQAICDAAGINMSV